MVEHEHGSETEEPGKNRPGDSHAGKTEDGKAHEYPATGEGSPAKE